MIQRLIRLSVLVGLTASVWLFNNQSPSIYVERLYFTLLGLTALYGFFRLIAQELVERNLKDQKTRYLVRKSFSILYIALFVILTGRIWIQNPETLVVAYGLIGAGVALALRDVFSNLAGGMNLFLSQPYKVGHRVEINGVHGDVIDIGVFYTRLLELRGWINGDQATGRTVLIPNGATLGGNIINYTQDNSFIWDEIEVPVKYGTDIVKASELMEQAAKEETSDIMEKADKELKKISRKYYLSAKETQPRVFIDLTDNWVSLNLRYISDVRKRRRIHSDISKDLIRKFEENGIEIASETLELSQH